MSDLHFCKHKNVSVHVLSLCICFLWTTSFYLTQSLGRYSSSGDSDVLAGVRVVVLEQKMQVETARPRNACGRHTGTITIHLRGKTAAEARK